MEAACQLIKGLLVSQITAEGTVVGILEEAAACGLVVGNAESALTVVVGEIPQAVSDGVGNAALSVRLVQGVCGIGSPNLIKQGGGWQQLSEGTEVQI